MTEALTLVPGCWVPPKPEVQPLCVRQFSHLSFEDHRAYSLCFCQWANPWGRVQSEMSVLILIFIASLPLTGFVVLGKSFGLCDLFLCL